MDKCLRDPEIGRRSALFRKRLQAFPPDFPRGIKPRMTATLLLLLHACILRRLGILNWKQIVVWVNESNPTARKWITFLGLDGPNRRRSLPSLSWYFRSTSALIRRRGAFLPVKSSNCAKPCSGKTSSPFPAIQPRQRSARICCRRGVFKGL